ncbi:MAG: hypothetical protein F6J87_25090 [Spirulina sp. SIO3F2]|nr:hypothetical protein [Spirulina sp. SIO3F2]
MFISLTSLEVLLDKQGITKARSPFATIKGDRAFLDPVGWLSHPVGFQ